MATRAHSGRRSPSSKTLSTRAIGWVRLWVGLFDRHGLLTFAAAIAYAMFVASVSLVLLGLGVLGAIGRKDVWTSQIAPQIQKRFLPEVYSGIDHTAERIFAHDSTGLIAFALLLAIWEVARAVRACMSALDQIYEADETRPILARFPLSLAIAVPLISSLLGAILLVVAWSGPSGAWHFPVAVGRWLGAILLLALAFAVLVRFAPAAHRPTRWISIGTALVVTGWIVQSILFRWYVSSLADFKTAIGTLTGFLLLTAFFSAAAIVLLVGIELDELLRKDARKGDGGILGRVGDLLTPR